LRYIAFDLPALAGVDLSGATLIERKRLLEQLLASQRSSMLVYGKHIVGHGERVFAASRKQHVEGIVSKRVDSTYEAGRTGNWLKLRHEAGREFVVIGYTRPKGSRPGRPAATGPVVFDSLLVARPEGAAFRYAGRVRTGSDAAVSRELAARLAVLASTSPLSGVGIPAGACRVEPRLVVEIASRGRDRDGLLRDAALVRLREDKSADELDPESGNAASESG
jgi:bifunctional non-homologous end joining protein LigD